MEIFIYYCIPLYTPDVCDGACPADVRAGGGPVEGTAEAVLSHPGEPLTGMRGDQVYRHVLPGDVTLV